MATRLRFEQQRKCRVARDLDLLNRVHLHDDFQLHLSGPHIEIDWQRIRRGDMMGKSAWRKVDRVTAQIALHRPRITRCPVSRCARHAGDLARVNRDLGVKEIGARLNFDERNCRAAPMRWMMRSISPPLTQ